jgi:hypothetical protein
MNAMPSSRRGTDGLSVLRLATLAVAILSGILIAGCATSHVMIGKARPPISADEVQIYDRPPPGAYEEIARLETSSQGSFAFTAQSKVDAVIKRLKTDAAKLGANGVILEGMADQTTGSVGTGGGSESYSRNSSVGGGVGLSVGLHRKIGGGLAIYVPSP